MHYFSTPFLVAMAEKLKQQGQYHIAAKKIPSKDGPVQASLPLLSFPVSNSGCCQHRHVAVLHSERRAHGFVAFSVEGTLLCSIQHGRHMASSVQYGRYMPV